MKNNEEENKKNEPLDNEQKYPKQTIVIRWINTVFTTLSVIFAIIIGLMSLNMVNEVKEDIKNVQAQYQQQSQELNNKLISIQKQYQVMQNIINQQQSVDVIQARENDVLIRTPDEKWIVVPMIEKSDITFSNQILEKQFNYGENNLERVDLFNNNNEDWSKRDSFTYRIPFISINQNKMVSLNQFIKSMTIEFKFFKGDKITYYSDFYEFYNIKNNYNYLNVFEDISTNKQYVTKELDDGIEDIKIVIIIEFCISGSTYSIPYNFDNWIKVNQDY